MNAQEAVNTLVSQRNGQVVNIDGADNGQCTAPIHAFDLLIGYPLLMGNACDYPRTGPASGLYTFIANSPTNFPLTGDVLVYLPNNAAIGTGPDGHTGVVVAANVDSFESFEQNDEPNVAAHVQARPNYEGVWGWLHPVKLQQAPTAPAPAPITMATVTATAGVWLHTGPGVTFPHATGQDGNGHPIQVLPYQATFQMAEIVQGEVVNGNNQWAKTVHGNFVTMAYLSISEQGGTKAFLAPDTQITSPGWNFTKLAIWCGDAFGSPQNFGLWIIIIGLWLAAGKVLHYSDTWQLLINTPTTIIELFAAILIQYVGNRIERRQAQHEETMLKILKHIESLVGGKV